LEEVLRKHAFEYLLLKLVRNTWLLIAVYICTVCVALSKEVITQLLVYTTIWCIHCVHSLLINLLSFSMRFTYITVYEPLHQKSLKMILSRNISISDICYIISWNFCHNITKTEKLHLTFLIDWFWGENHFNVLDLPNLRRCTRPCFSARKNWIHTMGFPCVQTQ
jgi:hypothetical protein